MKLQHTCTKIVYSVLFSLSGGLEVQYPCAKIVYPVLFSLSGGLEVQYTCAKNVYSYCGGNIKVKISNSKENIYSLWSNRCKSELQMYL